MSGANINDATWPQLGSVKPFESSRANHGPRTGPKAATLGPQHLKSIHDPYPSALTEGSKESRLARPPREGSRRFCLARPQQRSRRRHNSLDPGGRHWRNYVRARRPPPPCSKFFFSSTPSLLAATPYYLCQTATHCSFAMAFSSKIHVEEEKLKVQGDVD